MLQVMMGLKTRLFINQQMMFYNQKPDYDRSWESNGVCNSKLKSFQVAFLHCIKLSRYKVGKKMIKILQLQNKKNYASKIVNVYILYDLEAWLRNPTKNYLFGATTVVKSSDKENYVYSSYEITFDSAGS